MKKLVFALALSSIVLTSCKQENASDKIDPNAQDTPISNATPNPEPNIGGPDVPATKPAPPADGKYPVIAFEKSEHDFGLINPGDKVTYNFKFKNTGEGDLLISNAKGSCGCTVPEYPKEPVKPGQEAEIKVSFNSTGKHGKQTKSVTLETNTEKGMERLQIHASIKDKNQ
ncbi:DUF1573 domain-containing protein [Flavobacterium sp.]|uniref:DUF1573 domain-containing protein n=1 Tax=Flavobacterium sp. TaxID=239 RepID=UPI00121916CC|nr:DUF1573 domain-containing protein [Flavobacterium sp.]RZJ69470.1 MAG: DUF1573 domain-containing protein [Flavobacterium sp.]